MNLQKWQIQLRRGLLELTVLNLLQHRTRHGYEMVRLLKKMQGFSIREGNIYPILARLQMDGLVSSKSRPSSGGPPRKYFELTDQGRAVLQLMNAHWQTMTQHIQDIQEGQEP